MDIQVVRDALRRHPFKPFEIRLVDGRSVPVRQRELIAVGQRCVIVIADDDSWSVVEPILIVSIDYVNDSAKGNGKARRKPRQ